MEFVFLLRFWNLKDISKTNEPKSTANKKKNESTYVQRLVRLTSKID